jgi:subtilisin family serine protease
MNYLVAIFLSVLAEMVLLGQTINPTDVSHYYVGTKRVDLKPVTTAIASAYRLLSVPEVHQIRAGIADTELHLFAHHGLKQDLLALADSATSTALAQKIVSPLLRTQAGQQLRLFTIGNSDTILIEYPEIIVQFRKEVPVKQILAYLHNHYQVSAVPTGLEPGQYVIRVLSPAHTLWLADQLHFTRTLVEYAEPNFHFFHAKSGLGIQPVPPVWSVAGNMAPSWPQPADPGFALQWGLWNRGGRPSAKRDADVHILGAWKKQPDANGIRVAILDNAVDVNHPDLKAAIDRTSIYNATRDLMDDTATLDPDPADDPQADHATACAGIIAAAKNGLGIIGVAPGATIIPIQVETGGVLSVLALGRGINAAANRHADILSFSMSFESDSEMQFQFIRNEIAKLSSGRESKGIVLVSAAGNDDTQTGSLEGIAFPASESQSQDSRLSIIAVGASTWCDELKRRDSCDGEDYWHSRTGDGLVLLAPGVGILTTSLAREPANGDSPKNYRINFNGTSAATPFVAGAAALLLAAEPQLLATQVRDRLITSADALQRAPYRRLNVCAALRASTCTPPPAP